MVCSGSGQGRVTDTSIALFDDATIRPTISRSPSRSTSSAVPRSITDRPLVDVVAVAPRADVALRIERRPAQGARRAAGGDDPGRPGDERPGRLGGHPDAQQVGAILVLVVILVGIDGFAILRLCPRLDQHQLVVDVPAERQGSRPERLVDRLVERPGVVDDARGVLGGVLDSASVKLGEEVAQAVGEDRDLDLLEDDADDPSSVTGLQEERPIARPADRAGNESLGRVEQVSTSRHVLTLYRNRDQETSTLTV